MTQDSPKQAWYRILYIQVLAGVLLGILIGYLAPDFGKSLKPLGDGFIKLIRMLIAPVIFCTVVHGIASIGDVKKLGRVGIKTLLYFEVISTLALVIGLVVVNLLKPGEGFNIETRSLDPKLTQDYAASAKSLSAVDFALKIIPNTFFEAFASGDLLQVLLISSLSAMAICSMGHRAQPILSAVEHASHLFFGVIRLVVKLAPIGACGAMAFTIGNYGLKSLGKLAYLMLGFYLTSGIFVLVVLGLVARLSGFSIIRFLFFIKEELLLVIGTSSSETALPGMIDKMTRLGCNKSTVGLVLPTGYSFNLDGTNIYMSMAAIFLAQATNTPLTLSQQLTLLAVAMVTSKGASGVTGAGFVTLAATLSAVPGIPIESLAIIVGIDRFMSECRAITNLIGNGIATIVISRWEKEVSPAQLDQSLSSRS